MFFEEYTKLHDDICVQTVLLNFLRETMDSNKKKFKTFKFIIFNNNKTGIIHSAIVYVLMQTLWFKQLIQFFNKVRGLDPSDIEFVSEKWQLNLSF